MNERLSRFTRAPACIALGFLIAGAPIRGVSGGVMAQSSPIGVRLTRPRKSVHSLN